MYTQILSKNELIINTEEEKGEEQGRKKKKTKKKNQKIMDMLNTEKRKEEREVQLLNYKQIPLPCQKSMKTTERKAKAERDGDSSVVRAPDS